MPELIADSIFYYYSDLKVLNGCYLEIEEKKIACLVGRNGSGKSTLFKILSGELRADSGITLLNGNRLHRKSTKSRFEHLSYLPQKAFLPKSLRVHSILYESTYLDDDFIRKIHNQKLSELSFGLRRYVEVLFILSLRRNFVLLDEPFTGLSPLLIERVIGKIKLSKQHGAGILISDHYMKYITEIGDRYFLLENGQITSLQD
jgi:lipopolysaccharide export system ATP-binding protein